MNDKLNNNVTIIPPFKRFCMTIGELPSSYTESMTYYESLVWLVNYIKNTLIPAINNNGEAVTELQEKYIELKNYVDSYFENLDVQEEINNKLDDMAEQGQLAEIIAQYLEISSVLGFDTKSDLKGAENIVSGSICRTIGELTYNDGKGNYYKIRDLEEGDVIDEDNLVALTNFPLLVAEKIPDTYLSDFENEIQNQIEEITNGEVINKIFLATFFDQANEKVHFSTSLDGINFSDILEDVDLSGRDPQIIYNPNTKLFYISVTGGANTTNTDVKLYVSSDLVNWTTKTVNLGILSGTRWAPELFLDDNGDMYYFISVDSSGDNEHFSIYKSKCTDIDTLTFATALPVSLDESNIIDANVCKKDDVYYLTCKNNTTSKELIYTSTDLTNWSNINRDVLKTDEPCEGGMMIRVGNKFNFYGDTWQSFGYYIMAQSENPTSFTAFKRPNSLIGKRHGSVCYIEDKECVSLITHLDSYTNRVNVNKPATREYQLTGSIDNLVVYPNFIYRITGNTTISNLINAYDLEEMNFYFAMNVTGTLTINKVINSEYQEKTINKVIYNSRNNNEKINSISLIGNPVVKNNADIQTLVSSNYITFNTGWTGTIYNMTRHEDYIHVDADIKRTSGNEAKAFTIATYLPLYHVFSQSNRAGNSIHLYANGDLEVQGTVTDDTVIFISFDYYCPR